MQSADSPLINILIRTSNRPNEFIACIDSVIKQTYKNIRLIVCTDRVASLEYIKPILYNCGLDYTLFTVSRSGIPYHWNFYCNNLKDKVEEGWFFYLDDDDTLVDNKCLEKIAGVLIEKDHIANLMRDTIFNRGIICQFQRGSRYKPDPGIEDFSSLSGTLRPEAIVRGHIGGSCIFLHASQKDIANWDGKRAADYRFIKAIAEKIPLEFVPIVVVKAGNKGRHGR